MASIFTFESEPARVSSPWPASKAVQASSGHGDGQPLLAGMRMPHAEILANCGIEKLEAEPQEGPTEYKLHLLLRPRRNFTSTSTVQKASGSFLSNSRAPRSQSETDIKPITPTPVLAPSSQSRQNRLQGLTTQLLWRLQQSSPYHSSSKSSLVLPVLPDSDVERCASKGPGPLIPGLEESSGSFYEIGVSDDGTCVGLTEDELGESLTVLRAMAFSLGCNIQVLRMIIVGDCQWSEEGETASLSRLRKEKLWVAEVLVAPDLGSQNVTPDVAAVSLNHAECDMTGNQSFTLRTDGLESHGEQLRVSLTGNTTSGKSSLLGTLSTSTLDNGRGKSRLSLLKHRHEIVSGVTSSLAQELFGYQEAEPGTVVPRTKIVNYASGNVSSWDDIHHASDKGRLIFVTDSAGHPRYRRTTVRGLVSWAPHWTLCCIAADDQEDSSGKIGATSTSNEILGSAGLGVDLSKAHLDLCLKLNLPLVVVITKLDLATKTGLRDTLAKVLTTLKAAGRRPAILSSPLNDKCDAQLQSIAKDDEEAVRNVMVSVQPGELLVPIVLTSAVTGTGIGRLHALLRQLPLTIPQAFNGSTTPLFDDVPPQKLFHVDEVFNMPANTNSANSTSTAASTILSGFLRYGLLEVGEQMLIGPCTQDESKDNETNIDLQRARSYPGLIKGSPKAVTLTRGPQWPSSGNLMNKSEGLGRNLNDVHTWQKIRITSLRNLRLPVRNLSAGQVGTVGITLQQSRTTCRSNPSISDLCIRRGMVMLPAPKNSREGPLPSYSRFSAVFQKAGLPAWPGVLVIVYIASIRVSAKIVEVKALELVTTADEVFSFDDNDSDGGGIATPETPVDNQQTEIIFEFASTREWFQVGTQVLITPGGGPSLTGQPEQREVGSAGLDGYVGKITQAFVY